MSEAKHTPGPWATNFTHLSEIRATNGAVIAKCQKLSDLTTLQANARLIAAAPELLDALVRLKIEIVLSDVDHAYIEQHFRPWLDKAEKAIAKATQ